MDWVSFGSGSILTLFAIFLFNSNATANEDDVIEEAIEVNDHKFRRKEMSCQTCRKLKWHQEIEPDLWQCKKCKRHVDLRKAS